MTRKISRREFIKTASIGAAVTAVLTGCGPMSRYVVREPYTRMPEYTYNGQSTYYATTCRECPCGCGIVVRTEQGRALKVEGNKNHPVNLGKTCSRGQATLQGLYNPDRVRNPVRSATRGSQEFTEFSWEEGIATVQEALQSNQPGEIAFLMGMAPDHLFDLVSELTAALGAPAPLRYGAQAIFDAHHTLVMAMKQVISSEVLPYYDLANADVTFSFGANFLETYLSPMAYSRGYARMRRGKTGKRGYLVQFEPRLSQTAANADEWVPVVPGSDGLVALAIGRLVAEARGGAIPEAFLDIDIEEIARASGIEAGELHRLAEIFAQAAHPLAIPGGSTTGLTNGLEATQVVLALNALVGNLGVEGGLFLSPSQTVRPDHPWLPNTLTEMRDLIGRMQQGTVKVLFIHGVNPIFELPSSLGFSEALANVPRVISFASFPDETSQQADFILPDHTGLESWGYQKVHSADRVVVSGSQPVVTPYYNTRASTDVLLAAVQAIGGELAATLPYQDEVAYMQAALTDLVTQEGAFNAPEIRTFMAMFQQYGGWWSSAPALEIPTGENALNQIPTVNAASFDGEGEFYLFPYMSPILGDGSGANKPWLQETPDPTTTVMWNSWVEINPETAEELHLENDEVVKLITEAGEIEAIVYRYPAIRPDTIAVPFGQGHTAYGRYAEGRGANPGRLISLALNGAEELAFGATRVRIEKTGRKQQLSRLESLMGVYGEGLGE